MGAEASVVSATVTGMRVRAVRELGGRSRSEIARAAGITRRDLAAVERGDRPLSHTEAHAIADALDVDGDAFLAPDELATMPRAVVMPDRDAGDHAASDSAAIAPKPTPKPELALRSDIDDVLDACTRVSQAQSDDDVYARLRDLESTLRSTTSPSPR
jgi:transcriptional regulator with XRE-family HTH domain